MGIRWIQAAGAMLLNPSLRRFSALLLLLAGRLGAGVAALQRSRAMLCAQERLALERFQAVVGCSGVGMGLCDPASGRFLLVNHALCTAFARTESALLECSWQQLTFAQDQSEAERFFARLQCSESNHVKLRRHFHWPDGSSGWADLVLACTRHADGRVNHLIFQLSDVSALVVCERELQQQRQLLSTTINSLLDPLLFLTLETGSPPIPELRVSELNPAAAKFFSAPPSELVGQQLARLLPPERNEPMLAALLEVAQVGAPFQAAEQPIRLRQQADPLHVDVQAVAVGKGLVLSLRDVSERQRAARELRISAERFRLLAENSNEVVVWLASDGAVRWVSPSLTASLGWLPEEWIGKFGSQFLSQGGHSVLYQANLEILKQSGTSVIARDQVMDKYGCIHWVETHASPYINSEGTVEGSVAFFHLIDDVVAAEQRLHQSERRHRRLADHIMDVVWLVDLDGCFTYVSPSVRQLRGFSPDEVMAMDLSQNFTAQSYGVVQAGLKQARQDLLAGRPVVFAAELEELCRDGSTVWTDVKATDLRDEQGRFQEIVGVARDITAQHHLREQLRVSEERYRLLAENALDVIWTMEADGCISYISPSIQLLRGFSAEEAMAQPLHQIHPPDSCHRSQAYLQQLHQDLRAGRPPQSFRGELEYYCRDGTMIWTEVNALPVVDADGQLQRLLGVSRDISERKHYELQLKAINQQLNQLADTDGLTGIWNRRHLESSIQQAMQRSDRYGEPLTLILCDIDHFKRINDSYGHQLGDQVLIEFCARIQVNLRGSDQLGRWGGEEFLILLPQIKLDSAWELAEKLRRLIAAAPFPPVGTITASFGIAQRQEHESSLAWLRRVDDFLYAAKKGGRNQVTHV